MFSTAFITSPDFLGFYELDKEGTVLYSRPKRDGKFDKPNAAVIGRNFFNEIFDCRNAADFRRRFHNFLSGSHSTENFAFNCLAPDNAVAVRVMFVRVAENCGAGNESLVYVEIRHAAE